MQIAAASQPGVYRLIADVHSGKIPSPYRLACALGLSSPEARNRPATSLYLEMQAFPALASTVAATAIL